MEVMKDIMVVVGVVVGEEGVFEIEWRRLEVRNWYLKQFHLLLTAVALL